MKTSSFARHRVRAEVDKSVVLLFALVTEAVARATAALLEQDVALAQAVIDDDKAIDRRCGELTGLVKEGLADVAEDPEELETLIAILQIIPELERSADLAEHIARRTLQGLGGVITPRSRGLIQQMGESTIDMWQIATRAYQTRSRDASFELSEVDDGLDELAAALARQGAEDGDPRVAGDLALIARFYERLGDHAVNLARRIDVMVAPRRLSTARFAVSYPVSEGTRAVGEPIRAKGFRSWLRNLRLAPTNGRFFELFLAAAANVRDGAEELGRLAASFADYSDHVDRIRQIERRGDQITIDILRCLDSSFVTPYDREDIHALSEALEDVVHHVFSAASLIRVVGECEPLAELAELVGVLGVMAVEMEALMGTLEVRQGARYRLEQIEHLERQGDVLFRRAMAHLYSGDYEVLDVLKWKDIVQAVEDSLDTIKEVSDVVETILVKNS